MNREILKEILSCLDKHSFNRFVEKLWQLENVNSSEQYICLNRIDPFPVTAFEQVRVAFEGISKKEQSHNLVLPFYEPLELFLHRDTIKLDDSVYFHALET